MMHTKVTPQEFESLFRRCVSETIVKAQDEARGRLPERARYELEVLDKSGREATLEEVLGTLYVDGSFPRIVDVAVRGVTEDATIIWVRPSGHGFVSDLTETWNNPPGMGPFKAVGLLLPSHFWERQHPFSLTDLKEAAPSWATNQP